MSRPTLHLYSTLKYPLLVVVLVTHTSLRHSVTTRTHIIRALRDVATAAFAALTLMLAVLYIACLCLKMLPSHMLSRHIILRTACLVHLIIVACSAHGGAMMLLWIALGVSMVLLTVILAATLNRNSRL